MFTYYVQHFENFGNVTLEMITNIKIKFKIIKYITTFFKIYKYNKIYQSQSTIYITNIGL